MTISKMYPTLFFLIGQTCKLVGVLVCHLQVFEYFAHRMATVPVHWMVYFRRFLPFLNEHNTHNIEIMIFIAQEEIWIGFIYRIAQALF